MNTPPVLPIPPREYSQMYMDQLLMVLRQYFDRAATPSALNAATLNINVSTLPTQAVLADLRSGDVYRDTTTNTLKVKP